MSLRHTWECDSATLNIRAAATKLGISVRGVERLVASGRLQTLQVGRRRLIPVQALNRLLAEGLGDAGVDREPRRLPRA